MASKHCRHSDFLLPKEGIACKRRLLVAEARRWIGVCEQDRNRGEVVSLFQGWNDKVDHVAWCMAFIQYCLKYTDQTYDRLAGVSTCARHGLFATEHVMTAWDRTPKHHRCKTPTPGMIAVWQRYRDKEPTSSGHAGIVVDVRPGADKFVTVEGNTTVPVANGFAKGVGEKHRNLHTHRGPLRLCGFLDPFCVAPCGTPNVHSRQCESSKS